MQPAPGLITLPVGEAADSAKVLQAVVQNYGLYAEIRDRLSALQAWITNQRKVSQEN